jgi:hypothetical protein
MAVTKRHNSLLLGLLLLLVLFLLLGLLLLLLLLLVRCTHLLQCTGAALPAAVLGLLWPHSLSMLSFSEAPVISHQTWCLCCQTT